MDWWYDLRFSLRSLTKVPTFTIAAIATLALGIGANTAIFSVVHGVLLQPLPFDDPDSIVMVWQTDLMNDSPRSKASAPDYFDFKREAKSFSDLAAMTSGPMNLTGEGAPERLEGAMVSHGFFDVLGTPPPVGRGFTETDDRVGAERVVVISHDLWQRRFGGDRGIVGQLVTLDSAEHVVVGVAEEGFDLPAVDLWVPLMPALAFPDARGVHNLRVVGRLQGGVTLADAQAEMTVIAAQLEQQYPEDNVGRGAFVEPLREVVVSNVRPALMILFGSVGLVLLIACANVSGLMMTRAGARLQELSVRKSLGASRARIVRLLLTESVTLGVIGGALGVGLAFGLVRVFVALEPGYLPRAENITVSGPVLLFALATSLVSAMIFGIAPAVHSSATRSETALRTGFGPVSKGSHAQKTRQMLVVGQVAFAVILVVAAVLLARTFEALTNVSPGFEPKGVLAMDLILPDAKYPMPGFDAYPAWPEVVGFYDGALERVETLPGVESAALALNHPLKPGFTSQVTIDGRPEPEGQIEESRIRPVTSDYFAVTGIPLIRGRLIDGRDREGLDDVVVVNQAFASKHFHGEESIGQSVRFWGRSKLIVGIVGDVRFSGLSVDPEPSVYSALHQLPMSSLSILVKTTGPDSSLARSVQEAIWQIEPDVAFFNVELMEDKIRSSVGAPRFHMLLFGLFGCLAVVLAAVGIYSLLSYQVLQRTSEIGVRVALGATSDRVLRLFVKDGLRVIAAGTLLGILCSLGLTRFLASLLFGVSPEDALTLIGVALALGVVGIGASLLPALRAARLDPMKALRWE